MNDTSLTLSKRIDCTVWTLCDGRGSGGILFCSRLKKSIVTVVILEDDVVKKVISNETHRNQATDER